MANSLSGNNNSNSYIGNLSKVKNLSPAAEIDRVNIYEFENGMDVELTELGGEINSENIKKAQAKVLKNLKSDPAYYTNKIANETIKTFGEYGSGKKSGKYNNKKDAEGVKADLKEPKNETPDKDKTNELKKVGKIEKSNVSKDKKPTMAKKPTEMTQTPKKAKGIKSVMDLPGKEKKINLKEAEEKPKKAVLPNKQKGIADQIDIKSSLETIIQKIWAESDFEKAKTLFSNFLDKTRIKSKESMKSRLATIKSKPELDRYAANSLLAYEKMKVNEQEYNSLEEKLRKNAPISKYVKDFEKSDAPQFRGKSSKERRNMAVAAYAEKNPGKLKEEISSYPMPPEWVSKYYEMRVINNEGIKIFEKSTGKEVSLNDVATRWENENRPMNEGLDYDQRRVAEIDPNHPLTQKPSDYWDEEDMKEFKRVLSSRDPFHQKMVNSMKDQVKGKIKLTKENINMIQEMVSEAIKTAMVTTKGGTSAVEYQNDTELNKIKQDPNVTGIKKSSGQTIK